MSEACNTMHRPIMSVSVIYRLMIAFVPYCMFITTILFLFPCTYFYNLCRVMIVCDAIRLMHTSHTKLVCLNMDIKLSLQLPAFLGLQLASYHSRLPSSFTICVHWDAHSTYVRILHTDVYTWTYICIYSGAPLH